MFTKRILNGAGSRMFLGISLLILGTTVLTVRADIPIGTLQVGAETYQNVTVTSKTPDSIFITHSRGFANVKVADLGPSILSKLGYDAAAVKLNSTTVMGLQDLPMDPKLKAFAEKFATPEFQARLEGMQNTIIIAAWCIMIGGYLFFCYCCQLICQKAGGNPGIAVWIPIIQLLPLFQAAGMSAIWFFMALLPLATPILAVPLLQLAGPTNIWIIFLPFVPAALAYLIWCVKICRARGIGEWVAIFLILPWTNFFAFLYLAFSKSRLKPQAQVRARPAKEAATDTAFFYQT